MSVIPWKKLNGITERATLELIERILNEQAHDLDEVKALYSYAVTDHQAKEYWAQGLGFVTVWEFLLHNSYGLKALGAVQRGVAMNKRTVQHFDRLMRVADKRLVQMRKELGRLDKLHRTRERAKACQKKKTK